MTELEAHEMVRLFAAAAQYPELTEYEVSICLKRFVQDDGEYDDEAVHKAIADAWDAKAGKVSDHHDASVNGRNVAASQVMANCERMAKWYRRRLPVHVY